MGKIVKTSSSKVIDSILQVIKRKFGNKVKENWEDLTKIIKSIFTNPLSRMDL